MSQINILILVDVENIQQDITTGEITNPKECISMYDDDLNCYYKDDEGKSEIGTYVSSGDLLVWSILPTNPNTKKIPLFDKIENTSKFSGYLFNNSSNRAIIFLNSKKACAAISDNLKKSEKKDQYSYKVTFRIGTDKYWWDPFIEVRGEDE